MSLPNMKRVHRVLALGGAGEVLFSLGPVPGGDPEPLCAAVSAACSAWIDPAWDGQNPEASDPSGRPSVRVLSDWLPATPADRAAYEALSGDQREAFPDGAVLTIVSLRKGCEAGLGQALRDKLIGFMG